ncbi:MAG: glycosyltransferase [Patescibacteria group bacterium]
MKICYFGTYNSEWGRSRIYIKGLKKNGVEILECRDDSKGFLKYWKLFKEHSKTKNFYDFLIVGYPGHAVVWFAKLLSNKKVIFDALCTMEEGVMISRQQYNVLSIKYYYIKFIDWLAVKCADIVLVESEEQRKYFENKFGKNSKYKVVYTGADNSVFYPNPSIKKREIFTVLFRGKFLPEAGVKYIIETVKLLEDQNVDFLIVGNGWLEKNIKKQIQNFKLKNLEFISGNLSYNELRTKMLECHVSLGQFEYHERLKRTIPHKCFESLALGLPYITARTAPITEILKDGESLLFVNSADPQDLKNKILLLKENAELRNKIGENGYKLYQEKFTPKILAKDILNIIL